MVILLRAPFFREAPDAGSAVWQAAVRYGLEERHEPYWVKEITLPVAVPEALQKVWAEAQHDPTVGGWQEVFYRS